MLVFVIISSQNGAKLLKHYKFAINYDPDNSGDYINSLGVHEHWNNATDKQYTRNLGTGNGIELKSVLQNETGIEEYTNLANNGFSIRGNSPNPFSSSTTFTFYLPENAKVEITISDLRGKRLFSSTQGPQSAGNQSYEFNGDGLNNGVYIYRVKATAIGSGTVYDKSAKMILKR